MEITVVNAKTLPEHTHFAAVNFCERLRKKNSNSLGFYPKSSYAASLARGRLLLATAKLKEAGWNIIAGYCHFGWTKDHCTIYQICIDKRLRRYGIATEIIRRLSVQLRAEGVPIIRCKCREGLSANKFWGSVGFQCIKQSEGGTSRGKKLNHYERFVK